MHDSLEHFEGHELTAVSGAAIGPTTWSPARVAASGIPGRPSSISGHIGGSRVFLRHPLGGEIPVELGRGFRVHEGQWITAVWLGRSGSRRRRLLYVCNHSTFAETSFDDAVAAALPSGPYWLGWTALAGLLFALMHPAPALLLSVLSAALLDRVAIPQHRYRRAAALIARARRIAHGAAGPPEVTRQAFAGTVVA